MTEAHPSRPAGTRWDPGQYHRFADHRMRPALELLDRVPITEASLVYDLGCGSGNITRLIAERFAAARVAGVEISSEMLAKAASLDIWETEYLQRLEGEDPVLEWVKATGLRPILNGLDGAERERFIEVYRKRLRTAYPRRTGGHTLYPFRRLFMVATRRG